MDWREYFLKNQHCKHGKYSAYVQIWMRAKQEENADEKGSWRRQGGNQGECVVGARSLRQRGEHHAQFAFYGILLD